MVVAEGNCEGDTAAYSCNTGFELVGTALVTCQSNGMWDNPPPECQSLAGLINNYLEHLLCILTKLAHWHKKN